MRLIQYSLVYINTAHGGVFLAVFLLATLQQRRDSRTPETQNLLGREQQTVKSPFGRSKSGLDILHRFAQNIHQTLRIVAFLQRSVNINLLHAEVRQFTLAIDTFQMRGVIAL